MKHVSHVAAAMLTLIVSASTLALASDSTTAEAKKAPPAEAVKKAAPAAADKAIAAIDAQVAAAKVNKTVPGWKTHLTMPKQVAFDPARTYLARMVTNKGTMVFQFRPDVAPMHVTNFMYLAKLGFYDGLKFHRVMKGFMAQGGCPLGNGTGGPGYQFGLEVSPTAKHDKPGVLSTANSGGGNSDGSQFFVMFRAYPSLDMKYSVFGELVEGFDTLKAFEAAGNPGDGPPLESLMITKTTIEVK